MFIFFGGSIYQPHSSLALSTSDFPPFKSDTKTSQVLGISLVVSLVEVLPANHGKNAALVGAEHSPDFGLGRLSLQVELAIPLTTLLGW